MERKCKVRRTEPVKNVDQEEASSDEEEWYYPPEVIISVSQRRPRPQILVPEQSTRLRVTAKEFTPVLVQEEQQQSLGKRTNSYQIKHQS